MKRALLCVALLLNSSLLFSAKITPTENRRDISLKDISEPTEIVLDELNSVYYTTIDNNSAVSAIVLPKKFPANAKKTEIYHVTLQVIQAFLKKYRLKDLSTPNLGFGVFAEGGGFHNAVAVLSLKDLKKMDARDWGLDDMNKPQGKLPYLEFIKLIKPYNANLVYDSTNKQALKSAVADFKDVSLFDAFIKNAYYGSGDSESQRASN